MKIAVSGIGIVSSLGIGVEVNRTAISREESGIVPESRFLSAPSAFPVGEVPFGNADLALRAGLERRCMYSRTALLGILAVQEALADSGEGRGLRTGLVSGTSVGGMDRTEVFYADYLSDQARGRLRNVVMHDCAASTLAIARHCGIEGYTTTVSTACSSAANAILAAARLIRCGVADRVVAGGTDALSLFTLGGFGSLMILDKKPCRPFDAGRAGLNLGEGAGYIVLQREDTLQKEPYAYFIGGENANDAYHQTASSATGEGCYKAMHDTLRKAGVAASQIDYVNAHGTGTPNNDLSESRALSRLFGDKVPPFSSTKGFTGHTLAAAGGIEAVFSVEALHRGVIYPNLNFSRPMEETGLVPVTESRKAPLRYVLSNSLGFGGNCTALLFSKN